MCNSNTNDTIGQCFLWIIYSESRVNGKSWKFLCLNLVS